MKRILITGKDSYIGESFKKWLTQPQFLGMYETDTLDMRGDGWRETDFSRYDTVFHVAGIAHADVGRVSKEQRELYYRVNCDLAVETAKKAKKEGVGQFIYMSSIIVYGEDSRAGKRRVIIRETKPCPSNFYGDSKWKAEKKLGDLHTDRFRIAILRPPMIYGKGSKGNYPVLAKAAAKLPVFPAVKNQRSMLYIGNLCEFLRILADTGNGGLYFPQNKEYACTSDMVRMIAEAHNKKIWLCPFFNLGINLLFGCPGRVGRITRKAFGNLTYDKELSRDFSEGRYQLVDLEKSVWLAEGKL